jgi:type IV pilus assembly protein PilN
MTYINLLNWRDELRKERNNFYYSVLAATALLAGVLVFAAVQIQQQRIDKQVADISRVQQEIDKKDREIKQISTIKGDIALLLERMKVIQELQKSRPESVRLVYELAKALPDGLFLTSVRQTGKRISIEGRADAQKTVSAFMVNLNKSAWLGQPNLRVIQAQGTENARTFNFSLDVVQDTPPELEAGN